jgi:hypothetical protein
MLPPGTHTNLPNAYAATSDAARKDATQPHARRRIPSFALSVATTTLTKAHNSAPASNAAPGSPPGVVGVGIGPVLPMFCAASARQTNEVPAHTHHKLTESSSRGSLPLRTSYTSRSTSRGRQGSTYLLSFRACIVVNLDDAQ